MVKKIQNEHHFWTKDGVEIKSLKELHLILDKMDEEVFQHHVTEDRNDFHNWVKDIFQEDNLAKKLLNSKHQKEAATHIKKHLRPNVKKKNNVIKNKQTTNEQIAQEFLVKNTINFEQTVKKPFNPNSAIVGGIALLMIMGIISLTSKASITGAAVGDASAKFVGFSALGAIVFLAFVTLYALKNG